MHAKPSIIQAFLVTTLFSGVVLSCGGGRNSGISASGLGPNESLTALATLSSNPSWTHPANLNDNISPNGTNAEYPVVAINDSGESIIAWQQPDNVGQSQIFIAQYHNGAWTVPTGLTDNISPDGTSAQRPSVAINNSGDAVVAWRQLDNQSSYQTFASRYHNGVWTHPTGLTDNHSQDGTHVEYLAVAMDWAGNIVLPWVQQDYSSLRRLYKSEYRNGAWTDPATINDYFSVPASDVVVTNEYPVSVGMSGGGETLVAWSQGDGNDNQIYKSEYRNGAWAHPANLADNISPDGTNAHNPSVAIVRGYKLIVWDQKDATTFTTHAFKSEWRNGAWTHPASLTDFFSLPGIPGTTTNVRAALNRRGQAVIGYSENFANGGGGAGATGTFVSTYQGGAWHHASSTAEALNPLFPQWSFVYPRVDTGRNWHVAVWTQPDGSGNNQIFKSEANLGVWTNPTGPTDNISPDGTSAVQGQLNVAVSVRNNAVITWSQPDGSGVKSIFLSHFH